jgi:hypothetical protein
METPDIELIWLQKRAELCGCHVNRHLGADVTRGGDLYLQSQHLKTDPHPQSLCKYATVAEIEDALTMVEAERLRNRRA